MQQGPAAYHASFMLASMLRGDLFCLALCYFVLVFFGPFSIAITSLGIENANLSAFRTFVRFALVWFCLYKKLAIAWILCGRLHA